MLVTFTDHTGAAKEGKGVDKGKGRPADLNGQRALDYLLGEVVNKPAAETGRIEPTRRATPPELLSGEPWLFRQTVESLPFTNRYASGTLAFERGDIDAAAFAAGDPAIRELCAAIMRDFEETAFAGIPEEEWPHILWIAHTDKGNLELNFLFPRAVANADGDLRSFNPKPPGRLGNDLWDAFRSLWNKRYRFADPDDPRRKRELKLPRSVLKAQAKSADGKKIPDIREAITAEVWQRIAAGQITNRDDVKAFLLAKGYKLSREGTDYLSVIPKSDEGKKAKPIRLKGHYYNKDFTSLDWISDLLEAQPLDEPFNRQAEESLQARLDTIRTEHGDFLKKRLRYDRLKSPAPPEGQPILTATQDAKADGYIEADEFKPEPQSKEPEEPQKTRPRQSYQSKLWTQTFDSELAPDLQAKLIYVDAVSKTVWLKDKSSIKDTGKKIKAFRATEDTLRLMVIQARAKGWSGISIGANSKETLIAAAKIAYAEGVEIQGRTPQGQAMIEQELATLRAANPEPVEPETQQTAEEPKTTPEPEESSEPAPRFDPYAPGNGEAEPISIGPKPRHKTSNCRYTSKNAIDLSAWDQLYGAYSLPDQLQPLIAGVDTRKRVIELTDEAVIKDRGDRISVKGSSEDALRVIIAQAKAKGWTGLKVTGSEEYLRMAAKVGAEEGFPVQAKEQAMQAILDEALRTETPLPDEDPPGTNNTDFEFP